MSHYERQYMLAPPRRATDEELEEMFRERDLRGLLNEAYRANRVSLLADDVTQKAAVIRRAVALLRKLEFVGLHGDRDCYVCGGASVHYPNCELDAFLADTKEVP